VSAPDETWGEPVYLRGGEMSVDMMSQGFCLKKRKLPQCKTEVKYIFYTLFMFSPPGQLSNVVLSPLTFIVFFVV